jgi:hypothetical protein
MIINVLVRLLMETAVQCQRFRPPFQAHSQKKVRIATTFLKQRTTKEGRFTPAVTRLICWDQSGVNRPSLLVLVPGAFSLSEFQISFSKGLYASMVFDQSFLKFTNLPIAFLKTICVNSVIYGSLD